VLCPLGPAGDCQPDLSLSLHRWIGSRVVANTHPLGFLRRRVDDDKDFFCTRKLRKLGIKPVNQVYESVGFKKHCLTTRDAIATIRTIEFADQTIANTGSI